MVSPVNFDREKVVRDLVLGRDLATQLRGILGGCKEDVLKSSEVLVDKIVASLDAALVVLRSQVGLEESADLASTDLSSACSGYQISNDSGETKEVSGVKRRRGVSKRRKTLGTWTEFSVTPLEDGHAWRKYGQKEILGAKYPRSYFRCTYRNEQGCLATKQVQKTDDNPSMYHVTYSGHHTCRDLLNLFEPDNDFDSDPTRSYYLNFGSGSTKLDQAHPFPPFTFSKQDDSEEIFKDLIQVVALPEPLPCATTARLSNAASDGGDIFPGMCSSSSSDFELDVMVPDEILDMFRLDDFYELNSKLKM